LTAFLQAIATSGALMLGVLVVVTIASMAAHNRGETSGHHDATAASGDAPGDGLGFAFGPQRDPLVLEILGLGALLFAIAMGLLLGVSMLAQM
jgi:hypothetical protein